MTDSCSDDENDEIETEATPGNRVVAPNQLNQFMHSHEHLVTRNHSARRKWTNLEVRALKDGVKKFGKGQWRAILRDDALTGKNVFTVNARTNVNLKDKWRIIENDARSRSG
jgi:hypothetical protein